MAKKKEKAKAKPKVEPKAKKKVEPKVKAEPKVEAAPPAAIVPEQIVTRRGTPVGGTRRLTKSEYDAEMESGKNKD